MFSSYRIKRSRGALGALLLGLVAGGAVCQIQEAGAQGLFEAIFGGGGRYAPRAYAPPSHDERYGIPDFSNRAPRSERSSAEVGRSGTYCVRLCDGRYFPLPRATGGVQLSPAKVCGALCPAAQTQVFNGHPDHGVATDGTRYADLANALVYRDRVVPDCSCTGRGPGGLARIDVESDPTLRAGDVVATPAGLTAFKGGSHFPYKTADFTPVGSYSRVNADLRRQLSDLRVDPTATSAAPVQKLATGEETPRNTKRHPRRSRMQATDTSQSWGWNLFR